MQATKAATMLGYDRSYLREKKTRASLSKKPKLMQAES